MAKNKITTTEDLPEELKPRKKQTELHKGKSRSAKSHMPPAFTNAEDILLLGQNKKESGKKKKKGEYTTLAAVMESREKAQREAQASPKQAPKNNKAGQKNTADEPLAVPNEAKQTKKSGTQKQSAKQKTQSLTRYGKISAKELNETNGIKIAFLGGINEIGKNLTVFEYDNDIIVLDCGMSFPDAEAPGVDYVLPDFSYLERNAERVKAIFITHGHEDHIGGLPYLLKILKVPVYASALTVGLIQGKLKEHRMLNSCKINVIKPGSVVMAGAFKVEAIHVNHSIPDSLAFAIRCTAGVIVHTGDFKIDNTPIDGGVIDLAKFAQLGSEGVLCLMQDSTNAERVGYTPSEKEVGKTLESLFVKAQGKRIVVASFASNIHRIQQIVDASQKLNRKIFLSGRSLENVVAVSTQLGYLNIPDNILFSIDKLKNYRDEDVVIITTGSQGEPMSALTRMAMKDHRKVSIGSNDYVIISATPIPGNEKAVGNTINELMKLGAEVVYEKSLGIHVSGHAAQEEQKLIMNLVRPTYFIPVHGEQKHMRKHMESALSVGIPEQNILIPEQGAVVEVSEDGIRFAGSVPVGCVYVDASGVGDVGSSVLRERKKLSTDGIILITAVTDAYTGGLSMPMDIQTKGFVFTENANELNAYIEESCERVFEAYMRGVNMDTNSLRAKLKDAASKAIFEKTKRSPVIVVSVFAV